MDIHEPLFSIITVTFNAADTIGRTMESVAAQSATDYEHIVMDGVSRDKTLAIVERTSTPRTFVTSSPDYGIYDAMNKAIGVARGRYIIFLNAGDAFYDSDTLERFASATRKQPSAGLIYGQTVLVDDNGTIIGERHLRAPEKLTLSSFANGMLVCHQAMAVRRDITPLFDTSYHFSADFDWAIRILQNSTLNVYLGNKPVIRYLSEGMTTRNHRASLCERFRIMCRYYGTVPTTIRHIKFLFRHIIRRLGGAANKQ